MRALRHSWLLAVLPVWLGSRAVAYALAPANPVAQRLVGRTGGTAPVAVTAVAVVAALALAAGVLFVASLAVRERAALAGEDAPPPVSWRRVVARAAVLFVLATVVFTGVETLIHLQAGLGFHGWHCVLGPMHRDALPFLGAFAAAASLIVAAVERMVAWARRIVRALRRRTPRLRPAPLPRPGSARGVAFLASLRLAARGPPLPV